MPDFDMGFRDSITTCLRKSFKWKGRASRPECWWFLLTIMAVLFIASSLHTIEAGIGFLGLLLSLPALSVIVRRLHDTNRSAGWLLIPVLTAGGGLIVGVYFAAQSFTDDLSGLFWVLFVILMVPIGFLVGLLPILFFLVRRGDEEENNYGPPPNSADEVPAE